MSVLSMAQWDVMIKFQIRFSLSFSFLQFVQQTRTAVSSVPWIHANPTTDVCSSSVYVTTPGIERIKINWEIVL